MYKAVDLKEFYETPRGMVVQRILRQRLKEFWPEVKGQRVIGIGYALPYLKAFAAEAALAAALMPADLGAVFWPQEERGRVFMADEGRYPLESSSVDRIVAIHAFHDREGLERLLSECWRVLNGQGRLLLVVPNRTGLWARTDSTPFGEGAPWSMGQLRQALKNNLFVPERAEHALFVPPTHSRLLLATAPAWENPGRRFCAAFGGLNLVEAAKQLYSGTPLPAAEPARRGRIPANIIPVPERRGNF